MVAIEKYVSAEEVSGRYSVSVHGIRGWRRRGIIPTSLYLKIGGQYRYDLEGIESFFREETEALNNKEEVKEEVKEEASDYEFGTDMLDEDF